MDVALIPKAAGPETSATNSIREEADFRPEAWLPSLALYLVQVGRGLRHLHRHGIVHRDICANNILTDGEIVKA